MIATIAPGDDIAVDTFALADVPHFVGALDGGYLGRGCGKWWQSWRLPRRYASRNDGGRCHWWQGGDGGICAAGDGGKEDGGK